MDRVFFCLWINRSFWKLEGVQGRPYGLVGLYAIPRSFRVVVGPIIGAGVRNGLTMKELKNIAYR